MSETTLINWRAGTDVWRSMRKFDERYVDYGFRVLSAARLPASMFVRLHTFGVPSDVVNETLRKIRSLDDWSRAWVETAQGYLGTSRRETSAHNLVEAERARYTAAMCYHIAQIMEIHDLKTRDNCRAWTSSLVKQSLPVMRPNARHMTVQWLDRQLPILFEAPEHAAEPFGLVVLFNGISQSKEETFLLAPRFLEAGYAVLAIDSPGTGEATSLGPISASANDILDTVLQELRAEPTIDLGRLVLVGCSFGGNEAIRIARRIPQVMAVVTVTPAVAPEAWMDYANTIIWAELRDAVGDRDPREVATTFDITEAADKLNVPILIFGAGHDTVVPPNESQKLAERVGERGTLVWYPDLGHCLYEANDQWTAEAVCWLNAIAQAKADGEVDAGALNAVGRSAIEATEHHPLGHPAIEDDDEDFTEYARLITEEE